MSRPVSQVDLSGVSAAIESNYSDIVNKLDSVLASRGNELPTLDIPDYSGQLKNINDRLDEVTRAVVTLSVNPDNTNDHHTFERIEARLTSLSKSVDELMESRGAQPRSELDSSISAQISKLSEKLDNMDAMGAAGDALGHQIFPDVQEIANRIDSLQNDFGVLAANLEQGLASRGQMQSEASFAPPAASISDEALGAIEQRLGELAARFDEMVSHPGEGSNAEGQEILSVLREVVGRIDNLEVSAGGAGPIAVSQIDDSQFGALEQQLANITAQLGSLSAPSQAVSDFTPITERLDHIEGQIASSRDIVIEIATEAAQKAASSGSSGEGGHTAIAAVLDEIRAMRAEHSDAGANAAPGENAQEMREIGSTMAAIAERLSRIEMSFQPNTGQFAMQADTHRDQPYGETFEHPAESVSQDYASDFEAQNPDFDLPDARANSGGAAYDDPEPVTRVENAPSIDMSRDDVREQEEFGVVGDEVHAPDATFAADTAPVLQESAEAEVEDVPLAPGSGMPDLEALVKRATNRKKGGGEGNSEPQAKADEGISDLMAAARRAAQAASVEAQSVREMAPSKKPGMSGKLPKLSTPAFFNKKTLMVSAAVIALAVGGLTIGSKLFGGSDGATEISALDDSDSLTLPSDVGTDNGTIAEGEGAARIIDTDNEALDTDGSEEILADGESDIPLDAQDDAAIEPGDTASDAMPASLENAGEAASSELPSEELGNLAFRQAVASGDGNALFEAGKRYTDGQLVPRDLEQAVKWYTRAAEAGNAPAQYRLGNFYEKGHGVAADPAIAVDWYMKAAAQGNALAMHNLAVLNAMGVVNGDADMKAAIGWFEKAANLGVKDSQVNLGILYTKGMGVGEDLEKAYKWFAVAAKGGDSDAAKKRDTVAQAMRPEQLEKARGAAEIWKPAQLDAAANVARVADEWNPGGQKKAVNSPMSRTELVRMTQVLLAKAGFDAGPADGKMGAKTRDAIISFQKANDLNADGAITPELMDALTKVSI